MSQPWLLAEVVNFAYDEKGVGVVHARLQNGSVVVRRREELPYPVHINDEHAALVIMA